MSQALDILRRHFGYDQFRLQQEQIIETLIDSNDALVLMPTGGGKSLCYQIPAMVRDGVAIVISPLIALMQDQVDALAQNGISAAFLNSSQSPEQQQKVRQQLLNSEIELLYVAPERALTDGFLQLLEQCNIALFAIDEAHCVSQWGHDFRRDYQSLYRLHDLFPEVPRIALTATADKRTREEIEQQLRLQDAAKFVHSFDRPNIFYRLSEGSNNRQRLWNFLRENHAADSGIVYCLSRKQVESTAAWLSDKGRHALPYHAGLDNATRAEHQRIFLQQESVIIVATIAFGMGIDKPDVRFVAHLNLPKNIESYYQETGRAGRDGQPANAWLAYGLQDIIMLRQMMQQSDSDEQYKRVLHNKMEAMLGLCEQTLCRRQTLLSYFGESLAQPCGHCDNCIAPPQTWDATEASRMALSCVIRTGQRFGVNYVIDVLMGKEQERILQNNHHQLSTFGIGNLDNGEWRSLFRQLIALGYLVSDIDSYGALKLHVEREVKTTTSTRKDKKVPVRVADAPLFEALRDHRKQLADEQGVPPYVILHDKTLHELCRQRPGSSEQLATIIGIGARKLELYGRDLIDIIGQHPLQQTLDNSLSDTINETLKLHSSGLLPDAIATQRELSLTSIYSHLSSAISADVLELDEVIKIDREQLDEIVYSIEMVHSEGDFKLRKVFESLDRRYDYNLLNCVNASLNL